MRSPGDVLLLSCYELGHQPIGLAMPMAFLERAGYRPAALDLAVDALDEAAVRRARYVAISVPMHTALRTGMGVAAKVRALNPDAHLTFFGLYAPLNRELLLRRAGAGGVALADSVIGGEYEAQLVESVASVEQGELDETHKQKGPRARTVDAPVQLVRLSFPSPSRASLPPLPRYARLLRTDGTSGLAGYLEASRGCLHHCRHCPIPAVYDGRFFVVPEAVVVDDARRLVELGAAHITFGDPDFLNAPRHSLAVMRAIHAAFPSLTFDVTIKVEHIVRHAAVFPELARMGCLFVVSAVESLDERVLEILDKGHTRADVATALGIVRAAGMALRPSLVPFTPWETLDGYLGIYDFAHEHGLDDALDPVHLSIRLLVPPGSLLAEHPAMLPHRGLLDEQRLSYRWTHPDARMDALQPELAEIAARAAREEVPNPETFHALWEHSRRFAGLAPRRPARREPLRAPRLSEAWFC